MGQPPDVVLKDALSLTDGQVAAFKAIMDTRMQTVQGLLPQLDAAQQALDEALKASSPDPATLGALLRTVNGFRVQIRQADEALATGFKALLTLDQLAALNTFIAAEATLPVLMALQRLHI